MGEESSYEKVLPPLPPKVWEVVGSSPVYISQWKYGKSVVEIVRRSAFLYTSSKHLSYPLVQIKTLFIRHILLAGKICLLNKALIREVFDCFNYKPILNICQV